MKVKQLEKIGSDEIIEVTDKTSALKATVRLMGPDRSPVVQEVKIGKGTLGVDELNAEMRQSLKQAVSKYISTK